MALQPTKTNLVFKVQRREPELIAPSKPTPHECKPLSDIDDQDGLRFQIPIIQFYRYDPAMEGKHPAKLIREALGETLVFYYPFAGRIREGPNRKLMVECTGEGVLFLEADADVTLEQFGNTLHPPFPCLEELLFDVPGSSGVLHCPLLLIQVTRLRCGGFIFALRLNHTMSDAPGVVQFISAIGEIARGAKTPSVMPVWERHVLNAGNPPRVTCVHPEYDQVEDTNGTIFPLHNMSHQMFFFGPAEISALRSYLHPHHRQCSTFELLTACVWKCRTIAIQPGPSEEMRMISVVNMRKRLDPLLPRGYYGNAFALPAAVATAGELSKNPLGYALELIKRAKGEVNEEYIRSTAALLVTNGRPHFATVRTYFVSDLTRAGFLDVDLGWGCAAYGGTAKGGLDGVPGVVSFYIPFTCKQGEKGTMVPICLPEPAMNRFAKELDKMLKGQTETPSKLITSAL